MADFRIRVRQEEYRHSLVEYALLGIFIVLGIAAAVDMLFRH